jgi:hypothetical protein
MEGPFVEGLEEGDSVYLNDTEFELFDIMFAPPDMVRVVAYTPDHGVSLSGNWKKLRDDLGLKIPYEHNND